LYFRTQKLNLEIQIKTKVCTKNNRLNFKNML
jgi:hypothetical protein